jgi:hypothetical protein
MIRDLESSGTWMTLATSSRTRPIAISWRCLRDLAPFAQRFAGDIQHPAGFIFVSSPDSVTPAHFDIEHNPHDSGKRTLGIGVFATREAKGARSGATGPGRTGAWK